jgi:hypothetical protein
VHLWGSQGVAWKILGFNSWSMTAAGSNHLGLPVHYAW